MATPSQRPRQTQCILALIGAVVLLVTADLLTRTPQIAGARPVNSAVPAASRSEPPLTSAPVPLPDPVWRIAIREDGFYVLSYEALASAGFPVAAVRPQDAHLTLRGNAVALREIGMEDGKLDPGDGFVFYGERHRGSPRDEQYTDEAVYWLSIVTGTVGLRMDTLSAAPVGSLQAAAGCVATHRSEHNLLYWPRYSDMPGTETTWFWDVVTVAPPSSQTRTYALSLSEPLTVGYQATLTIEVASANSLSANPDHHLRLAVNDTLLGDFFWEGKIGHILTATIPAEALLPGDNALHVSYTTELGPQRVYFDRAEITYHRFPRSEGGRFICQPLGPDAARYTLSGLPADHLYMVGDTSAPIVLTDAAFSAGEVIFEVAAPDGRRLWAQTPAPITPTRYAPVNTLISPSVGADLLIVAPDEFLEALDPLKARREAEGLRVRTVAVEDIYPLFSGGIAHPEAIRALVAHAHAHWPGPPLQFLFLVGGASFNPRGYNPDAYGPPIATLIPPYLDFADPLYGDVPVDSRFGDVDGDGLPEVSVGRLPARSIAEVAGYVAKVAAYEASDATAWQSRLIMVADNGRTADEGFAAALDRLVYDKVSAGFHPLRIYMRDYCSPASSPCVAATQALLQNWNQGAALLVYMGHGAIDRWADEPLLINTQLRSLEPGARLPFLLSLDCWDGYWVYPSRVPEYQDRDLRSMADWATAVLTQSGAIAAFGPAGLAYPDTEERMARAIFDAIFEQGVRRVGSLTQAGRQAIGDTYMARTYTLLGDPSLALKITPFALGERLFLPVVMRGP